MLANFLNIAFAGLAYGVLLFLMAAGLSVTMGLMRFANLAHAAFAMLGGYIAVTLMNGYGWPFLLTLPVAAIGTALFAAIIERAIFRRLYRSAQLDQVMLTVGLLFMAVASATFIWGPSQQPVRMPDYLSGQVNLGFLDLNVYRLFLILAGGLVIWGLIWAVDKTSFGAKVRAAVDNRRVTSSCGINVDRLFMIAFFVGSSLAGLGGALSINLLGIDPNFAQNLLAFVLIVVVIGGEGSMRGTLLAALLLGLADVIGKYYVPQAGAFIIYALTVAVLFLRPQGLLGPVTTEQPGNLAAHALFAERSRWRWQEIAYWVIVTASIVLFPTHLILIAQVLITGLFALSFDLLVGYAGIASLGHAAFFGIGAYTAGIVAHNGWGEPITGLLMAGLFAGGAGFLLSTVVSRLHGIALLMITFGVGLLLYEGAHSAKWLTNADDGLSGITMWPLFGKFDFDFLGRTAVIYTLIVAFILYLVARRIVNSPFGLQLKGMRENIRRVPALGVSIRYRYMLVFTISAVIAGIAGGLLAQITQTVALPVLGFDRSASVLIMVMLGGMGSLIGATIGAAAYMIAQDRLSSLNPVYWNFWLGLLLVLAVLFARGGLMAAFDRIGDAFHRRTGSGPQ